MRSEIPFNYKLWLVEAFVRINDWERVEEIIGGIYDYKIDLTLHKPLLNSLFSALNWFIEPLYAPFSKSKFT
jgi:hypothetical protein